MSYEMLTEMVQTHKDQIVQESLDEIKARNVVKYAEMPVEELRANLGRLVDMLGRYISQTDVNEYREAIVATATARFSEGYTVEAITLVGSIATQVIKKVLTEELNKKQLDVKALGKNKTWLDRRADGIITLGQSMLVATRVKQTMHEPEV